jgi:hypothetical protein
MKLARARTGLALALVLSAGCHRYTPTDASLVPPGEDIRVLVTRVGAAQLEEVLPDRSIPGVISGTMNGVEGDDVLMRVPVGARREGFVMVDMVQTIRVPMGEILGMERRELNKAATGLLLVGAAALGVGVVFGIIEAFGTAPPPDEGPPPEEFSAVIGRFFVPWGG